MTNGHSPFDTEDTRPLTRTPPTESSRWGRMLDHLPFGFVLLVAFVGMILIVLYHWRWGSALIGCALVSAAVLRGVLPEERVGLIAVRGKPVDVFSYVGLALCVWFVAYTLHG